MAASQEERVAEILTGKNNQFKTIDVFKEVDPLIDEGNLLLSDLQPIELKQLNSTKEKYLASLARDNIQLLFNKIWQLPIERKDNVVVVKLPPTTTFLPREKPVPKPKPPTKWEKYAKDKGINNKKRGRMIWDEETEAWKPRFGYKRGKDDTKEWCLPVPGNADPMEDQFQKKVDEKKERIAKNELKRLRNIAKNQKGGTGLIMSTQFQPTQKKDKERMTKEIDVAKTSTASIGKFQDKLPKEKPEKNNGKKRKFEPVAGNMRSEAQKTLDIWNKVNKPAKLDVTKGVNKHIANEQSASAAKKSKGAGGGKVKNKRYRQGKQAAVDKKKSKTLGKGRR